MTLGPSDQEPRGRVKWAPGAAGWMWVCLLVPASIYLLFAREPAPRWRAAYFSNPGLEGAPLVRRERDVHHDWRDGTPADGLPSDEFSARWDSCLVLDVAQSVAFQLTSDDGARLWIDGRAVLDDWERQGRGTRGTNVSLDEGVHHLRVEYHELSGLASVVLAASFDETRPARIAPERLRFPDSDAQLPCPAGRAPVSHPPAAR